MSRYHRVPATIASATTAAGLALVLASCGGTGTSAGTAPAPATSSAPSSSAPTSSAATTSAAKSSATTSAAPSSSGPVVITIKDFTFAVPATVAAGATVMVKNEDSASHTVTSKAGGFDVKVDGGGGTAMLTAPTAGSYELLCDFHANMKGTLVVQ